MLAAPGDGDWPQFRGPQGNGIAAERGAPTRWTPDTNIAWKTKLPGIGWSQPVVSGGKIFLTTAEADTQPRPNPEDYSPGVRGVGLLSSFLNVELPPPNVTYRWKVICLDAASGSVLWEQLAYEGKPTVRIHPNNSYATETPVTDGERLIAYFGMTGVFCYDFSGKLLWKSELGAYPMQMGWGSGSSPAIHDGRVFIQCDNDKASFLVALDAQTGQEIWRAKRDERSNWSSPYVWKNKSRVELVTGGGTKARSYEPATGKVLWELDASGRTSVTPVGDEDLVYLNSADRLTGQRGVLDAVRAGASGALMPPEEGKPSESVAWSIELTGHRVASPLLLDGCLYLLEQQNGILRCFDAKSGKEHYRQRVPGATGFTASPWAADGKLYCLDQKGQTFVIELGPQFKLLATNKVDDEMFWSTPAISGRKLLVRGLNYLFCVGE
jgi:outer membrane protein assembly factor BamB